MIALPPNSQCLAGARLPRTLRAAIATVALLLTLAPAAHADGGGVAIGTDSTSAKAASTEPAAVATAANTRRSVGKVQVRRAQTLLRVPVTGRHDVATRKSVKRFQELRGLAPYGVIDLTTYRQIRDAFALLETGGLAIDATGAETGGATTATPEPTMPPNLAPITDQERTILDKIAQCESKGDPRAISASGQFRGKYQFDRETWTSVGGSGDPAAASEVEQDQRAAILLRQRGAAPWPNCGL
jgi:hypothetical protein